VPQHVTKCFLFYFVATFCSDITQNTSDGKSSGTKRKLSIAFKVSSLVLCAAYHLP